MDELLAFLGAGIDLQAIRGLGTVFLVGLLGGVHCVGMCGGIVSALSVGVQLPRTAGTAAKNPAGTSASTSAESPALALHLAYNAGRITSYMAAGALMGAVGSLGLLLNNWLPVQMTLYVAANLMMVALGLYLAGATRALGVAERAGQSIWRRVQPWTRRFLPVRGPAQAFPLGMVWGWLPCGMVYSVLAMTLLAGSAARGALIMLAFGLGTLPNLMLAGLLLARFRRFAQDRRVRTLSGMLVLGFGIWGLFHAATLGGDLWAGVVCHPG